MNPSRRRYRRALFVLAALLALVGTSSMSRPHVASAHPLGNFTINRYTRIEPGANHISLRYVLDMAEIPTFQEMARFDLDRDPVSEEDRSTYLAKKTQDLMGGMYLTVNGSPIPLKVHEQELGFLPGQGGIPTLRLSMLLQGAIAQPMNGEVQDLYYRDDNYAQRLGWREIVVTAGKGVSLLQSSVPQVDKSNELRAYPQDKLSSPLDQTEARSTFVLLGPGQFSEGEAAPVMTRPVDGSSGILASLVAAEQLSLPVVIFAIMVALGLGALHAVSPGHGKTIMAAYLVGTRGTARHALFLGFTVTISHTIGVLGLGLVVLYASHVLAPERLYPWLALASGGVIIAIGAWLLVGRVRANQATPHDLHDHVDATRHTPSHRHTGRKAPGLARYYWQLRGIVGRAAHGHAHADHALPHREQLSDDGRLRITWKSLVALGVVGGLLPSASALIILLAAISLHRFGFGLLLILAFSAGMAAVLAGVGLLLVYTRRVAEKISSRTPLAAAIAGRIPLITALVVLVSGLIVAVRAAYQIGLV